MWIGIANGASISRPAVRIAASCSRIPKRRLELMKQRKSPELSRLRSAESHLLNCASASVLRAEKRRGPRRPRSRQSSCPEIFRGTRFRRKKSSNSETTPMPANNRHERFRPPKFCQEQNVGGLFCLKEINKSTKDRPRTPKFSLRACREA